MINKLASKIRNFLFDPMLKQVRDQTSLPLQAIGQKSLSVMYKQLYHSGGEVLQFKNVGFRAHSQHEEDGILLFIFSLIGTTNMQSVEICAGDGTVCNTANLIINHKWIGLLCDGKEKNIERGKKYYSSNPNTKYWPPKIIKAWITKDNVNGIIKDNGFSGEIDLLSLDIDGVDYWIWKEISVINPRVVVLEFNHLWGPEISVSVPYRDDFVAEYTQYGSDYAGASLNAFVKLGEMKGYRLVGTNTIATNAFFVRNDIECNWLPKIEPNTCFNHPRAQFGINHRLPAVKNKVWVEV